MTINEIAKSAGVSIGTVDRVLHNRGRVAEETRETVLRIAKENGYHPNTFARTLKLKHTFTFGILIPSLTSEYGYWNLILQGIEKAQEELSPLFVSIVIREFDRGSRESYLKAAHELDALSPDGYVIAPMRTQAAREHLETITAPVVFIDSPLPDCKVLSTIAQHPSKSGFLAGRMMHLLKPDGKNFIIVTPPAKAFNSIERAKGFVSFFSSRRDVSITQITLGEEDRMPDEMRLMNDVDGYFVVNDAAHHLSDVLSKQDEKKHTIIGYDLIDQNRKAMEDGKIDCIISQRPENQGYMAIYLLYHHTVQGLKTPSKEEVPIDIILKENLPPEGTF